MWAQQNMIDGVHAMSMALLTRGLGWSREQVELLLVGVRDDLRNRAVHSYIDLYAPLHPVSLELLLTNYHYLISVVFYGRRPESS